jgi:hypothetical protein
MSVNKVSAVKLEAKIRSRQTRLNEVDKRWKIDRSVKRRRGD